MGIVLAGVLAGRKTRSLWVPSSRSSPQSAPKSSPKPKRVPGLPKTALYAMEHATLMLATSQFGITVFSLLILLVSEPALHHLLEVPLGAIGLDPTWVGVIAFAIALIVVTFLHVVFGEMVPKNISFSLPDRAVLILAPPLVAVSKMLSPLIRFMNAVANGILRLFGVEPKQEATSAFTLDEVANIVAESTKEGMLRDQSGALSAAFEFTEKTAADVVVSLGRPSDPARRRHTHRCATGGRPARL